MNKVQVWEEKVIIPTYEAGKPDKNPMFLEKRVYQGSSGRIYPHTVIEKISDKKVDKEYTALFLENDYLKVMMLPELPPTLAMAENIVFESSVNLLLIERRSLERAVEVVLTFSVISES